MTTTTMTPPTVEQIANTLIEFLKTNSAEALDYYCAGLAASPSHAKLQPAINLAVARLRVEAMADDKHADALEVYGKAHKVVSQS